MEFEFNAKNLSKPWFRLVIGIIFVVAGIFCFTDMYSGITRENCVEAEVTLYEMRVDLTDTKNSRDIWLIFEDYDDSLNIHPSCVTDEFLSDMLTLKKGAKMKILHSTKNSIFMSFGSMMKNGSILIRQIKKLTRMPLC